MSEPAQNRKKDWAKPRMTVLSRKKPDEAVLSGCKTSFGADGAEASNYACELTFGPCDYCLGLASS